MRRLLILRHAKSGYPPGTADFDRPLDARGETAAPQMGAYMTAEGLLPDLALISTAERAQKTWQRVRAQLPESVAEQPEPAIYDARTDTLLDLARAAPDSARTVLMVGHNPGMAELALRLTGFGDRYAYARMREKFPTAALAVLDFDTAHWRDLRPGGGRLERFVTPQALGFTTADD